ncbi:MAG: Zn-ribbon domain-containing OB-fold protein [Nocardioidaceae bacterium]
MTAATDHSGPPLPPVNAVTRPWWDATRERRLVLQRCETCRHWQHYPRAHCVACGSRSLAFEEASGRAVVDSFTVVHRPPYPGADVPYVVARVRLSEGPVLLTNLVDCDIDCLQCDQQVVVTWRDLRDGRALPVFRPLSDVTAKPTQPGANQPRAPREGTR